MFEDLNAGVNLGGWISQYGSQGHEHFRTFITGADIQQIAGWGMDHVRLPVDYPLLEWDSAPFAYREDGFAYIDHCLEWCQRAGLGLVLDLHHAPGFSFNNELREDTRPLNVLFHDPRAQERFIKLWEAIARRYQGVGDLLTFELMNEVVLPDSAPWNALARQTVARLRAISPERDILIGGNRFNAAAELKNLEVLPDPRVHYTFHFYEPMFFTHQKAPWVPDLLLFGRQTVEYPGPAGGLKERIAADPRTAEVYGWLAERPLDRDLLEAFLQPALEFTQQTGRRLYCGEFGVIESAPAESRNNWLRDFTDLLRAHQMSRAIWSYKQMDFGLVDARSRPVDEEAIRLASTYGAASS